jgi:L-seryl-tRNA(Ser) seleniumtransferase
MAGPIFLRQRPIMAVMSDQMGNFSVLQGTKMAIPSWAVEALVRGVGSVVDRVPPERIEQMKQRAGQWLDELPQSAARGVDTVVRGARAGKEMIDRWAKRHTALVTPVINGSGCLIESRIQGVPIGLGTLDLVGEAFASPPLVTEAALDRLQRRLNRCTGQSNLSVLVAGNVDAACLAIGMTRGDKPFYIHRSQSLRLASGTPIPEAFVPKSTGAGSFEPVHEVGSVDGVTAGDCASLSQKAIFLAVDNGGQDPFWFAPRPGVGASSVVLMMACAGFHRPNSESGVDSVGAFQPAPRCVVDLLTGAPDESRADLVITSGDGLLGGPACGLIIGRKDLIDAIAQSPIWPTLAASMAVTAMMTHALETFSSGPAGGHPVLAMVHTGEENLRSRAERLAIRLSGDESIRTCQVSSDPASLTAKGPWRIASRQVRLQHQSKSATTWAEQLLQGFPAVLATVDGDTLVIDLRWVPASDDCALAAAVLGQAAHHFGAEEAAEQTPSPTDS